MFTNLTYLFFNEFSIFTCILLLIYKQYDFFQLELPFD